MLPLFRLGSAEAHYLAEALAETGMGFQLVELPLRRWSAATLFLALNSKYLLPGDDPKRLLQTLGDIASLEIETFREIDDVVELTAEPAPVADARLAASRLDESVEMSPGAAALLNQQPLVATHERKRLQAYFRLSAFRNDRRIGKTGDLKPGTYATTFNDLRMVPSGYAAVGRYALPSPLAAKYVFPIVTDSTPIKVGTTVPNFGQAGGGVEVLFPKGARHLRRRPHQIPSA